MNSKVSAKQILAALKKDPKWKKHKRLNKVLVPFIEAIPNILADILNQPSTLQNLIKAKLRFHQYCYENGITKVVMELSKKDLEKKEYDYDQVIGAIEEAYETVLAKQEEYLSDIPKLLEIYGMTEEQFILSQKVGLNTQNRRLYRAGKLTIAEVLKTQPRLIVQGNTY